MAEKLGKDPQSYKKERDSFLNDLQRFHLNRGTPFQRFPCIRGKDVDLFELYSRVTAAGGWEKVNEEGSWEYLAEDFNLPAGCTNSDQALKRIYIRYLDVYERVNHKGEDPDKASDYDVESSDTPGRRHAAKRRPTVPLRYNYTQHQVPVNARAQFGLSMELAVPNPYMKLEASLLSGLPNEIDFAFNIATLLSNEGRHTLALSPRLLRALLAHVAVFDADSHLQDLHLGAWQPAAKTNLVRFWSESVEDPEIRNLILPRSESKEGSETALTLAASSRADSPSLDEVFNVGRQLGMADREGQRVLQLAMILRNLSFEKGNMQALSSSTLVLRFLMLCIHSRYGNLRQLALDTLSNMALQMSLDPRDSLHRRLLVNTMLRCISSADKYQVISGLEMLARLCQVEENEDVLCDVLPASTYATIVSYLTVHDIQLIVYTLECLYQLSELGDTPSSHIAQAPPNTIATLTSLVTIEAQSYGPESIRGIKVVEHVSSEQLAPPASSATPLGAKTPAGLPQRAQPATPLRAQEPTTAQPRPAATPPPSGRNDLAETQAGHWLMAFYEPCAGVMTPRAQLYADYTTACAKYRLPELPNAVAFANAVRQAFPTLELVRATVNSTDFQYKNLRRRPLPRPFPPQMHGLPGSTIQRPSPAATPPSKPPVPKSSDSTLIKSLLANKLAQNMHKSQALNQQLGRPVSSPAVNAPPVNAPPVPVVLANEAASPVQQQPQQQRLPSQQPMLQQQQQPPVPQQQTMQQTMQQQPVPQPVPQQQPVPQPVQQHQAQPQQLPEPLQQQQLLQQQPPQPQQPSLPATPPAPPAIIEETPSETPMDHMPSDIVREEPVGNGPTLVNGACSPSSSKPPTPLSEPPMDELDDKITSPTSIEEKKAKIAQLMADTKIIRDQYLMPNGLLCHNKQNGGVLENGCPPSPMLTPPPHGENGECNGSASSQSVITNGPSSQGVAQSNSEQTESNRVQPSHNHTSQLSHSSQLNHNQTSSNHTPPSSSASLTNNSDSSQTVSGQQSGNPSVQSVAPSIGAPPPVGQPAASHPHQPGATPPASLETQPSTQPAAPTPSTLHHQQPATTPVAAPQTNHTAKTAAPGTQQPAVNNQGPGVPQQSTQPPPSVPPTPTNQPSAPAQQQQVQQGQPPVSQGKVPQGQPPVPQGQTQAPQGQQIVIQQGNTMQLVQLGQPIMPPKPATSPNPQQPVLQQQQQQPAAQMTQQKMQQPPAQQLPQQHVQQQQLPQQQLPQQQPPPQQQVQQPLLQQQLQQQPPQQQQQLQQAPGAGPPGPGQPMVQQPPVGQPGQTMQPAPPRMPALQPQILQVQVPAGQQVLQVRMPPSNGAPQVLHVHVPQPGQPPHVMQVQIPPAPNGQAQTVQVQVRPNNPQQQPQQQPQQPPASASAANSNKQQQHPILQQHLLQPPPPSTPPQDKTKQQQQQLSQQRKRPAPPQPAASTPVTGKKRARRTDSVESNQSSQSSQSGGSLPSPALPNSQYVCEWEGCKRSFENQRATHQHFMASHFEREEGGLQRCQWDGCDTLPRAKWSFIQHAQERHLSEQALQAAALRRQLPAPAASSSSSSASSSSGPAPAPPVYPNDAALQAIRRFAAKAPYPELMEAKEGPVTKHIRLTSALILRNLSRYSAAGRSLIKRHEQQLAYVALSAAEASNALATCLAELHAKR